MAPIRLPELKLNKYGNQTWTVYFREGDKWLHQDFPRYELAYTFYKTKLLSFATLGHNRGR